MAELGWCVSRRKTGGGVLLVTSSQGRVLSTRRVSADVDLDHLAEAVSVRCLHCPVAPSLSTLCSSGGRCSARPTLRGSRASLLGARHLRHLLGIFLCGRFVSFPSFTCLFNHLSTLTWAWEFHSLGDSPLPRHCSQSSSWPPCLFNTPSSLWLQ